MIQDRSLSNIFTGLDPRFRGQGWTQARGLVPQKSFEDLLSVLTHVVGI